MAKPQWIKIGLVGRPHGVRGGFFVAGRDEPLPKSYREVRIGSDPGWGVAATVQTIGNGSSGPTIMCSAAKNRDEAEAMCGRPIWVSRAALHVDQATEFLWADLMGRPVVDGSGQRIGHCFSLYNAGASDIAIVKDDEARAVELPLVSAWFDMDSLTPSQAHDTPIRLVVDKEIFADLWSEKVIS